MRNKHRKNGFTLIEILTVVAIIGVLSTLALPAYSRFILRSHRADARDALAAVQFAAEKWRANNSTYTANLSDLGLTTSTQQKYYVVSLVTTSSGYIAVATATGGQTADSACLNHLVTEKGAVSDASYTAGTLTVDTSTTDYKACWGLS